MRNKSLKHLPDKPSAILRVALADLYKIERDPKYYVFMGSYHDPRGYAVGKPPEACEVCLAGCVIASSPASKGGSVYLGPGHFNATAAKKLRMLDAFMNGWIHEGLYQMRFSLPEGWLKTRVPTAYDVNPLKFKRQMRRLARDLERVGL